LEGLSSLNFDKHPNRPEITLRGFSTINGPKSPLIIVDNFPYDGDINNLDPSNIESITLLKDGAASSIWGTRAGNGVIVVTTKSGKRNSPSRFSLESNVQVQLKPDLFRLDLISNEDLISVERFLFQAGRYTNDESSPARPYLSPVVVKLIQNRDKVITDQELEASLSALGALDNRRQYLDKLYRNETTQRYALSHSFGGANFTSYNNLAYTRGISDLSAINNRLSFQNSTNISLSPKIDLDMRLMYTKIDGRSGNEGYKNNTNIRPYTSLIDEMGQNIPIALYNPIWLQSIEGSGLLDWHKYPLEEHKYSFVSNGSDFLTTNVRIGYKMLDALRFDFMYNTGLEANRLDRKNLAGSYFTRDLLNRYTVLDEGNVQHNIPYGDIIDLNANRMNYSNYRVQATVDINGPTHGFAGIAGFEIRTLNTQGTLHRQYGVDPEVLTVGKVDYNRQFPDFISGRMQFIPFVDDNTMKTNVNISQFFNGSYVYKGKYTLSGSARRDASNVFGVNTNDRWTPLWSLGAMWNLLEEPWINLPFENLKLKMTYGQSGLVNNSRSAKTVLNYRTSAVTNFVTAVPTQYPNPELRWEKSNMFNLGLDFSIGNGTVSGDIAYYHKIGKDLLGPSPVDLSTGVGTSLIRNVASMKGTGVDLNLNIHFLKRSIDWRSHVLFSYNRNSVTDYNVVSTSSFQMLSQGGSINPIVGKSLYGFLSYDFRGLDENGNPLSTLANLPSVDYGAIRTAHYENLIYSGSATPIFFGSVGNSVAYKSFTMSINVQYKLGHYFLGNAMVYNSLVNMDIQNGSGLYKKRWKEKGDELHTDVPSFLYPINSNREQIYTASTAGVERADHIRLQFVRLAYDVVLRRDVESGIPLKIFLTAENLGIIWRKTDSGLDPDYGATLPPNRRFTAGFSIIF
ncbi:MAG TPA: TonB-dependent receptor, partial [Parapedobacter sp.]|nr:TonB-dependent receptor [Parapedobacter sp.]